MKKIFLLVCCLGLFSCIENTKKQETSNPSPSVSSSVLSSASPVESTKPSTSVTPSVSPSVQASPSTSANTQIANPASVYCIEQGGKLDIRNETGGQVGYCVFDDKSECEEWAFFRGDCKKGQIKK